MLYNGFGGYETKKWQVGDFVTADLYQEDWNGKPQNKFKAVRKEDLLEKRIEVLEKLVKQIGEKINPSKQTVFQQQPDDLDKIFKS